MTSPELQQMLDERQILKCLTRYSRGVDRHDPELIRSAFHDDAWDRHGAFVGQPDAFEPWVNDLHATHTRAHHHFLSNHTVEIDHDVAHSEIYVHFILNRKNEDIIDIGGARYIDRLEKRDGEWRIADRVAVLDWVAQADQAVDVRGTLRAYPRGQWGPSDLSYARPMRVQDHLPETDDVTLPAAVGVPRG